ncbi:MAG: hypothetical protein QOG53_1436 [Frankiales bacterium]|nr:hypothetical protein [Frankiales bacterium]
MASRSGTAARPVPERGDEFAHLSLERLRTYRQTLADEENRVSYWRRIVQARLDLVRAGHSADVAHASNLRAVLSKSNGSSHRTALVTVVPVDDMPPLPDLVALWERDARPDDQEYTAVLERDLDKAERDLSEYRTALHERIAAATNELIARYRETPNLALCALPSVPSPMRRRAAL